MASVSLILLSGGSGKRMRSIFPKQYLELNNKKIISHSLETFFSIDDIFEIIIVCHRQYEHIFTKYNFNKKILFAKPGLRRQDSVFSGLQKTTGQYVCIHDGARPLVTKTDILNTIENAKIYGAAAVGCYVKNTIKMHKKNFISKTLKRKNLFEVYTPQVIQRDLLIEGFALAAEKKLEVTDDVSLIEHLKKPVKLVEGSPNNLKITTELDLLIAQMLLTKNKKKL